MANSVLVKVLQICCPCVFKLDNLQLTVKSYESYISDGSVSMHLLCPLDNF